MAHGFDVGATVRQLVGRGRDLRFGRHRFGRAPGERERQLLSCCFARRFGHHDLRGERGGFAGQSDCLV